MSHKLKPGDLVTRTYDYQIDSIVLGTRSQPYGIVLEIIDGPIGRDKAQNVTVYWFKDVPPHTNKTRVNNSRFLRLVNSVERS